MRKRKSARVALMPRIVVGAAVIVGAVAWIAGEVTSQEKDAGQAKEGKAAKEGQAAEEMAKMMAAWAKYAAPGEHHGHLGAMAGDWDLAVKWRMSPDAPMEEEKATSELTWILGGRFLLERVLGDAEEAKKDPMMDGPFEGLGLMGYDNYKKKYVSMWVDTMGTMMLTEEGTCSQSGKVITLKGTHDDPITGKKKNSRSVTRIVDKDKLVVEMYEEGPDGKEFRMMEITYTRKK